MWKIENNKVQSHNHPQDNTNIFFGKPLREKSQLGGETALLSFLSYGNNASTKKKELSMELPETCGLLGYYKTLTSSIILSNIPILFSTIFYGTKYNNIE
jgi:hypothetical protein